MVRNGRVRLMSFYELHCRSAFSFLSSGSLPEDLSPAGLGTRDKAAIALLDRDTVSGAVGATSRRRSLE